MATALNCCLALPSKFKALSINTCSSSSTPSSSSSSSSSSSTCLSFSTNLSGNVFSSNGNLSVVVQRPIRRYCVVCEVTPNKKPDSAAKRARQAEKRRVYNKSKKSEVKTRM